MGSTHGVDDGQFLFGWFSNSIFALLHYLWEQDTGFFINSLGHYRFMEQDNSIVCDVNNGCSCLPRIVT